MAEYITIMIINNKTRDQISSELEDLIGSVVERGFIDWLFVEAAKGAPESELGSQTQTQPTDSQPSLPVASVREGPSDARRNPPSGPRGNAPLYQQAISQALPNQSPTSQKRTASARSPSPSGQSPNKSRRTDLPSGPRAMRDVRQNGPPGPRSLLERVGPRTTGNGFPRPDNMPTNIPGPGDMDIQTAIAAGFLPPGMDMNAIAAAQMGPNPLLLQEMMINQMAMMAQMATSLGMMNPSQFGGFPMQAGAQDVGMYGGPGGFNNPPMGSGPNRGRGSGRGGYSGRGRGGAPSHLPAPEPVPSEEQSLPTPQPVEAPAPTPAPVVAPTPIPPQPARPNFAVPERPQSPTLCKFSLKCTNPHCRWSHPSPVATPESGVVLSNEPCEQGKDCKDKDCIKGHISPAAVNHALAEHQPTSSAAPSISAPLPHNNVYCRYGASCIRRDCAFQHPASRKLGNSRPQAQGTPCRFGAACTRAACTFQHPEGRVLPSTFHRGLSTTTPIVSVAAPPTGSMGAPSPHKTVIFNKTNQSKTLGARVLEIEEEKKRTIQAVKEAEEAAAAKKDNSKRTPIAA
ncbi:hypothetical protein B0F90DRAFT_211337 [Multifurca ochricompacta]|uniref:Uncharacterized protein n=1 Tax=Multifurca ochricompacta TaxID=376703 RepID=A0AAD4QPC5_9AGAM|nr:hypothetical protein B0F90DRAFT_211337 [Multifurca ochricompacta]